jgi:hypothetical protein
MRIFINKFIEQKSKQPNNIVNNNYSISGLKNIGEAIRELLRKQHPSQERLAEGAGIT